jgi:hypothetical protein
MKKVSLLSFYLIATVAILSSWNTTSLNDIHTQQSSLIEKTSTIGGDTPPSPTKPKP